MEVLLRGAQVFYRGELAAKDLLLSRNASGEFVVDRVLEPGEQDTAQAPGRKVVDLEDKLILPGLADVHVHLREPGFSYKETIATGTAAAARGGFTTVCAMPNLDPPPDNVAELVQQVEAYARDGVVEVFPYSCLTQGGVGTGAVLDYQALAPLVVGFSDDGFGVQSKDKMRQVMEGLAAAGGIVAQHCEDLELSGDGYINDGEYARVHGHKGKPGESEWAQLERDLELVAQTGCNYHACHVSTAKSVELIRQAKAAGLPVTAEAAPHYLALSEDMLEDHGRFRMNPPLRFETDREAVAAALVDGTIDMVATDHAPHGAHEKDVALVDAANGVVGLEISVPVIFTHFVKTGLMDVADFVRVMSTAGRERFGLGGGSIEEGTEADLIIFDPNFEGLVDPDEFASMGRATPFQGHSLSGRVDATVVQGNPVWDPQATFSEESVSR